MMIVVVLNSSCIRVLETPQSEEEDQKDKLACLVFRLDSDAYDDTEEYVQQLYIQGNAAIPSALLDTSKYLLKITNSSGKVLYDSLYTARPSELYVKAGNYKISLRSSDYREPNESYPLFGEDKTIKAIADSTMTVSLIARQMTPGVKFEFTSGFKNYFRGNGIYLHRDTMLYKYLYNRSQYVYFYPGTISVKYKNKDEFPNRTPPDKPKYEDTLIFKKKIRADEMVTIKLDYDLSKVATGAFSIKIDTLRIWNWEHYNVPGIAPYGCQSVLYAQKHIGDTICVFGYIVGTEASSSTFVKRPPFSSKTHIVIASQDWQSLREKTLAVELSGGAIRKELNLVDNPTLHKKPIVVRGVVADSYFSHPGLKHVTFYKILTGKKKETLPLW